MGLLLRLFIFKMSKISFIITASNLFTSQYKLSYFHSRKTDCKKKLVILATIIDTFAAKWINHILLKINHFDGIKKLYLLESSGICA